MRYGPDDKFWVVVDPKPHSTLDDLVYEASLRDLDLQFKGGLQIDENPTLFTDRQEARLEAYGRLTAMRASQAILRASRENPDTRIDRVEVYGADGEVAMPIQHRRMAPRTTSLSGATGGRWRLTTRAPSGSRGRAPGAGSTKTSAAWWPKRRA